MHRKNLFSKRNFLSVAIWVCLSVAIRVSAEVPHLINYQGRLLHGGLPVSGIKSITFKIWSSESGGTLLWEETQNNVSVTNGIFNVLLGNVTSLPASVFETATAYLETIVENTSLGRQRLVSVGYAFKAETISDNSVTGGKIVDGTISTADIGNSQVTPAKVNFNYAGSSSQGGAASSIADGTVTSAKIVDGTIVNADISAGAGIATSKLSGAVTSISGHGLGSLATKSTIANADVASDAAIATSKLSGAVTSISGHGLGSLATKSTISDGDVASGAAISPGKISGTAWTSTNDGAGSGLDADLLDGQQPSAFASATHYHDDRYLVRGIDFYQEEVTTSGSAWTTNPTITKNIGKGYSKVQACLMSWGLGDFYEMHDNKMRETIGVYISSISYDGNTGEVTIGTSLVVPKGNTDYAYIKVLIIAVK